MKTRINITIDEELLARMRKLNDELGIPISAMITKALEQYLKNFE